MCPSYHGCLLTAWQPRVSKVAAAEQTVGTAGQPPPVPCSPSRGAAINPTLPLLLHTQMPNQTHTHTESLQRSHPLPIILGSNFISTRVAAHCRQPLQSFLINSRFVLHPSFWTHLSYIPIGAAPSTPRQPPFANPSASPTNCPTPRNSYCFFFLQPADHLLTEQGRGINSMGFLKAEREGGVGEGGGSHKVTPAQTIRTMSWACRGLTRCVTPGRWGILSV